MAYSFTGFVPRSSVSILLLDMWAGRTVMEGQAEESGSQEAGKGREKSVSEKMYSSKAHHNALLAPTSLLPCAFTMNSILD